MVRIMHDNWYSNTPPQTQVGEANLSLQYEKNKFKEVKNCKTPEMKR